MDLHETLGNISSRYDYNDWATILGCNMPPHLVLPFVQMDKFLDYKEKIEIRGKFTFTKRPTKIVQDSPKQVNFKLITVSADSISGKI